jgi:two pore calcium channel protein, plant
MTILLTTSNFPDIMLPALHQSTFSAIFFLSYLILGLYFLLNALLATIFSGYKRKMQERVLKQTDKRVIYLEKYFNLNDSGNKGYLSLSEAKKFFTQVLGFDYSR